MSITKNTSQLREKVAKHIAADAVLQGIYWDGTRGCFIGCLSHSDNTDLTCRRFGLNEYILLIAEHIFEALSPEEARQFFADFPDAIQCDGKDLSLVPWQFLASELRSLPPQPENIQAVINPIITGMDLLANGREWPEKEATRAAAKATWAAEGAAKAAYAAWAAEAVAKAAKAAVWAPRAAAKAAYAAWAAEGAEEVAAVTRRQRDLLLRLIREAPVVSPTLAPIAS